MISAKVICDGIGKDAPRITTFELVYPRMIHSELMTHRVFSRNASSSRAIPVKTMLKMMQDNPALPSSWRLNERGMQGHTEASETMSHLAETIWLHALAAVTPYAEKLDAAGFHKQHVNRLLEPWAHMRTVVTATQYANWFALRDHTDADPTIAALAVAMKEARDASIPELFDSGDWYLPYVTGDADTIDSCIEWAANVCAIDIERYRLPVGDRSIIATEVMKRVSAARCARTSYKTFDGQRSTVESDFELFDKLIKVDLIHASPTEHQASPDIFHPLTKRWMSSKLHGNFNGWIQHRKTLANETQDVTVGEIF